MQDSWSPDYITAYCTKHLRPMVRFGTPSGSRECGNCGARDFRLEAGLAGTATLTDAGINGGRERHASAALNACLGPMVKISLNYVDVLEVSGGPFTGVEPSACMRRTQLAY